MDIRFTWSPAKAKRNLRDHKIGFELARNVFSDPYVVIYEDCQTTGGEMRYHALGYANGQLLVVVVFVNLSEGGEDGVHIISARKAIAFEETTYADQFSN